MFNQVLPSFASIPYFSQIYLGFDDIKKHEQDIMVG
jgi:hypothetical protein